MVRPSESRPSFDELYAQIRALPEGKTGMILEPGELTVMSRPHPRHQRAMQGVRNALRAHDRDVGGAGWWLLSEVEVRFGDRLSVPDITGYRTERVPEIPDENPLTLIPDWTCEVLSPTTAQADRLKKLRVYAGAGVPWTWLVDPESRSIECFESVAGLPTQTHVVDSDLKEDALVTLPPFGTPLRLSELWGARG
jgi:Uma2 family endonuclease